jgi:hypothetical protein
MKTQAEYKAIYDKRKQWFLDRVGKRVYRDNVDCECEICSCVGSEGLIVIDIDHAAYLTDISGELGIKYRDLK